MVKKDARTRMQESVGTRVTRRTVTRGIAWTTPVVAVAAAAPAFAASTRCQPIITIDQSASCKCPGQSQGGNEFTYFLKICVANNASCPVSCSTTGCTPFLVTRVAQNGISPGNNALTFNPSACEPGNGTPTSPATPTGCVDGACTAILRYTGGNSAEKIFVTVEICGESYTAELDAPVNCSVTTDAGRCTPCTQPDNILP